MAFKATIHLSSEYKSIWTDVILLSSEYHCTKKEYLRGLIKRKKWLRERQGIALRLLEILEDIEASP